MKRFMFMLFAACILAGCGADDDNENLICGDYEIAMEFEADNPDILHAVINSDPVDLNITQSASGARYQGVLNDTTVVLWGNGTDWTLMLDEDMIIECASK